MRINRLVILVFVVLMSVSAFAQAKKPITKQGLVNAVKINGIQYSDRGNRKSKNAIVFVHCWTCNSEFWKDSVNAFPNYRVISLDLPGHGQSDKRAVAAMVARLVVLPKNPSTSLRVKRLDDEVDAIAVGLTCLASVRYPQRS